jgi:oxygen-dependent protoporphyrinogen oxidase
VPSPRIAIVGAGMAGLAAAHRLHSAGAEVVLIERASAAGRAQERAQTGFRVEGAPLLVGARDRSLRDLGGALASADRLPLLRPVAVAQLHRGALRETDAADFAGLRRLPGMPLRDGFRLLRIERLLRRFGSLLSADHAEHAVRLDDRSVADFVRLYFGAGSLERWAQPLLAADLGLEVAHTSRAALLRHHVGRAEIGLGRLRTSVAALGAELTRGAQSMSGDARGLRASSAGYELSLASGARVEAEAVLLAVPPHEALRVAGELLTAPEADVLAASRAEACVVVSLACDGGLTPHSLWVRIPREAGIPLAAAALEPGAEGGFAPPGRTLVQLVATPRFSRAHLEASDDAIARSLAAALERVKASAARSAAPLGIARFEWARPCFDVGRYRALAGFARVQADRRARGRRLYFAGDWLNAPTLEGAASSGLRAAEALLADFGAERAADAQAR